MSHFKAGDIVYYNGESFWTRRGRLCVVLDDTPGHPLVHVRPKNQDFDDYVERSKLKKVEDTVTVNNGIPEKLQLDALRTLTIASGIEVGDTVKVVRDLPNNIFTGLSRLRGDHNVRGAPCVVTCVNTTNYAYVALDDGTYWPVICLELVKKAKPKWTPVSIYLNEKHSAEVLENYVKVGCQTFDFEAIENLYEQVQLALKHAED